MSSEQTIPRPHEDTRALLGSAQIEPVDRNRRSFKRFFFWLFLIPFVLYVTAIPLVRMPGYERFGISTWGPYLDFAFHTQRENADVVIFGDSSAFLGIDPRLLKSQLGIKAVVIPNTIGSLPVIGTQGLDFYLAHNTRPRLIVLYFTPWDLDYESSTDNHIFEGEEMLLRYGSPRQILQFALRRPLELPLFPVRSYSTVGLRIFKNALYGADGEQITAAALGHVDDILPLTVDPNCTFPADFLTHTGTDTARNLVTRYTAQGYHVVVYLAPIPDCSNASAFATRTYDGLALAPSVRLPPPSFVGDGILAHLTPEGVPEATRILGNTIAAQLKR